MQRLSREIPLKSPFKVTPSVSSAPDSFLKHRPPGSAGLRPGSPTTGLRRWLYIVVYIWSSIAAALLAVAVFRALLVKTKADYLVAGRSLPAIVLVLTLLTSWIGAGSLFAGAENAYKNGFAALWQPAGGWLGLLLIYFIAPRARKFAQFTLPDLLEARYNQTARVLGTIAILFAYVAITSYQFKGGGNVLHLIFPDTRHAGAGHLHHCRLRHRHHGAGRHVVGGLYGCGHRLAGHRHLHHRHAHAAFQGRRMGRPARRAAATHFRGSGQPHPGRAPRVPGAHHAAHAGQPGHVPEILLGQIRARRAHLRRRLDSGHRAA
jgi:hypothetical protein